METEVSVDELSTLPRLSWLVRPCEQYKEEYGDCRSIKGKFHQYFIHGETKDCTQWKTDYDHCLQYRDQKDLQSLVSVIESEKERRNERLRGHYSNTVWEKRDSPPEDWNKPLPENLQKDEKLSYLSIKTKEQKEGKLDSKSFCTIS